MYFELLRTTLNAYESMISLNPQLPTTMFMAPGHRSLQPKNLT